MSSASALPIQEGGAARRRYARYQLSLPFGVTVFRPSSVVHLSGMAQEIGEGGLGGVISGAALPGERVELTLALPAWSEPLQMRAMVRHQSGLLCGFEFLSLEHGQREQLQQLAADPAMRARLINETEWEPGMAPPAREPETLCPNCGHELPEEIPVCLMCGAPRSAEVAGETAEGEPAAVAELEPLPAPAAPPAKNETAKARRGPLMDSVVAIVFLVTLTIGLWQWLQSPVEANPQPSFVTVELENVFLLPAPSVDQGANTTRSRSSAALSAASSVVTAVIGSSSSQTPQAIIGAPGSAAAEGNRRREEAPVSNAPSSPPRRSAPAESAPSLPSPASVAAAPASVANNLPPLPSSLTPSSPTQSSSAPESSSASSAPAEAPSSSDLAGMLLQKVLPVYPTAARRQGVQGQVVLKAVIGKDGNIAELRPLQGPQELTAAAMDAVQHWRFRPYQLKGKPVEVETDIRLNFQLPNKK